MFQNRILLLLLSVLIFWGTAVFAQTNTLSKKEIKILTTEATRLLKSGKHEKSLIQARIALKHAIASKDDNLIANSYNIIAANFDELSEFEKAFFYYKKGMIYANKTNNYELKNWLHNNLGNIYCFNKKQYKKGIYHYKKSLEYSKKGYDSVQFFFTKLNITWAYFDINEFEHGLPYLQYINKHHQKHSDESTLVVLNMLNGMYYSHINKPKKAIWFFEKSIQSGTKESHKSDLSFSHQEYSKFLLKIGDYKKAYQHLELYNKINAELNYEEKLKNLNIAGINLEIDEYKREIDNIETKYKSKEQLLLEKQSKNKKISIVIISVLLLIIIVLYFLFQNIRLKQKNKITEIRSQIQERIINASINGQEIERKKIALFLHDNISALLSSAGLHLSVITKNQVDSEEIKKTKAILNQAHEQVRDLSHELLPSLLTRFGLFYALNDFCEKITNSSIHFKYSCKVSPQTRYHEEFEMKMYFIITELLNNIIKHSQANKAKLSLKEKDNQLIISVSDNGKGFDINKYKIIEGFGLYQIKARINNNNGEFKIDSIIDSGTTIHIKVPIVYKKN